MVLLLGGGGLAAWRYLPRLFASQREDLLYHTVKDEPLQVTVVERGALEAARNDDLICEVKASGRGSTAATTIKRVIDDGTQVKKGDIVIELDTSGLKEQEQSQSIVVDKAKADEIAADGQLEIVRSQNESDLSAAEIALKLAELDLKKYTDPKGDYMAALHDVEGRLKQIDSDLEILRDRLAWSQRMVARKFLSSSQADADESRLKSSELTKKKTEDERNVLEFTKEKTIADFESKVREAKRNIGRVKIQNAAKENTAKNDLETKRKVYKQEKDKLDDIQAQIAKCVLRAPKDGMAVYYVDERTRSGFGSQQSVIMQGEPVREGQKLVRIPDLDHMLVNTRVHEAMVSRVRNGMPVDVKIDAFPDRVLKASVRSVATVAIQNDWRSADVKMYQTMVSIDESLPGLKPGMSAEVIIHVDATDKPVPTVPVQAIVGGPEMGTKRKIFVKGAGGQPEEREVEIGLANDKMAEIRSGVAAGDQVVLNPKVLVGDQQRTRQPGEFSNGKQGGPGGEKPGSPGAAPNDKPGGPGPSPGGPGPNAKPGSPGGPGPSGRVAGAGMPKFDPAKMQDPEYRKKMLEDPAVQKWMRDNNIDPSKMRPPGGGGGPAVAPMN